MQHNKQKNPQQKPVRSKSLRGLTLHTLAGTLALGAVVAATFTAFTARSAAESPPQPDAAAIASMLHAAGLGPDALAAAGLTPAQTSALVAGVLEDAADLVADFRVAQHALHTARNNHTHHAERLRSGRGGQQNRAGLADAKAALDRAEADLHAVKLACLADAADGLPADVRTRLDRIRANRGVDLPVWHLAADRDAGQWLTLRRAIAAARIHAELDEPVPTEVNNIILDALADQHVAAAKVNFETNRQAVNDAWRDAVQPD